MTFYILKVGIVEGVSVWFFQWKIDSLEKGCCNLHFLRWKDPKLIRKATTINSTQNRVLGKDHSLYWTNQESESDGACTSSEKGSWLLRLQNPELQTSKAKTLQNLEQDQSCLLYVEIDEALLTCWNPNERGFPENRGSELLVVFRSSVGQVKERKCRKRRRESAVIYGFPLMI